MPMGRAVESADSVCVFPVGRVSASAHPCKKFVGRVAIDDRRRDAANLFPIKDLREQPRQFLGGSSTELAGSLLAQDRHLSRLHSRLHSLLPDVVQTALKLRHHRCHRQRLLQSLALESLRT